MEYMQKSDIEDITSQIEQAAQGDQLSELYYLRGRLNYQHNNFGQALNDLRRSLEIDPTNTAAQELIVIIESILEFHNSDLYNP